MDQHKGYEESPGTKPSPDSLHSHGSTEMIPTTVLRVSAVLCTSPWGAFEPTRWSSELVEDTCCSCSHFRALKKPHRTESKWPPRHVVGVDSIRLQSRSMIPQCLVDSLRLTNESKRWRKREEYRKWHRKLQVPLICNTEENIFLIKRHGAS